MSTLSGNCYVARFQRNVRIAAAKAAGQCPLLIGSTDELRRIRWRLSK
jgi:hypothetical protein